MSFKEVGQKYAYCMKKAGATENQMGWLFADELELPEPGAVCLTISNSHLEWHSLMLAGRRGYQRVLFEFQLEGDIYVHRYDHEEIAAFSTIRPFVQFSYIGQASGVLDSYEPTWEFSQILPVDIAALNRLFLKHRVVFVGVSSRFGPHVQSGFITKPSFVPQITKVPSVSISASSRGNFAALITRTEFHFPLPASRAISANEDEDDFLNADIIFVPHATGRVVALLHRLPAASLNEPIPTQ